jgi:hypothetical protein
MSYLFVKWNSCACGPLADGPSVRARMVFPRPLPEQRPATPQAARLGVVEGAAIAYCRLLKLRLWWFSS